MIPGAPGSTAAARTETFAYDAQSGRVKSIMKPEGMVIYGYDDHSSLNSLRYLGREVSYRYDSLGRLQSADSATEGRWEIVYNAAGKKKCVEHKGGPASPDVNEDYTYDALGRLTSITHTTPGEDEPFFKVTYTLDADGNRITAVEERPNETVTWNYEYDELGRLVNEHRTGDVGPARDVSYTYDADSNRSSEIDLIDSAKSRFYEYYPESQRLHYIKDGSSPTAHILEEYEWTANGEMKRKLVFDPATGQEKSHEDYTWGIDGTLKAVVFTGGDNDGYKLEYDYDHEGTLVGRREYKKNGAGAYVIQKHAKYLVDSENLTGYSQILAEINGLTGKVKTYNILTDQLAAQSDLDPQGKPTTKLLQTDALGSIRAVSQKTIDQPASHSPLDYTAFGSLLSGDRSLTNYAFTGQLVESLTGQQHHRARWLNTTIGRWTSIDPEYDFPANYGSPFNYCGQDPINRYDHDGTMTNLEMTFVSGMIGGLSSTAFNGLINLYMAEDDQLRSQGYVGTFFNGWLYSFAFGAAMGAAAAAVTFGTVYACMAAGMGAAQAGTIAVMFTAVLFGSIDIVSSIDALNEADTQKELNVAAAGLIMAFVPGGKGKKAKFKRYQSRARLQIDVSRSRKGAPGLLDFNGRSISKGKNPHMDKLCQQIARAVERQNATDIRIDQSQVNAAGDKVGINRPDLQYTRKDGKRVYIEFDTDPSTRGPGHRDRILANDPDGIIILFQNNKFVERSTTF